MRFYRWRLTGVIQQRWENHVFPADGIMSRALFTPLCEDPLRGSGGHSGENKNEYYCPRCRELAPIVEAAAQSREDARVAQLELQRPLLAFEISSIVETMSIDEVIKLLNTLRRKS